MNRLVRGTVLLAAVAAIWSCEKDPTGANAKTISTVAANPSVVFVNNLGDSTGVVVQALNNLNQPDSAVFTLGTVGPGIIVNQDTSYGHVIGGGNLPTSVRYFVKAASTTGFVTTSFQVSAGGVTTTIPVKVTIASIPGASFNNVTPGLGDTVQLTAPAGVTFTSATTIAFADTSLRAANVGVSSDGTILYVLPGPGINGDSAVLSGVELSYAPGIPFDDVTTSATITTDTLPNPLPVVTVSDTMPAVGDTITVTAPPLYGFTDDAEVTLGNGAGNALVGISADRTQLRFIVGPDASGPISVSNAALGGVAHLGTFDLVSTDPVNSPPAPALAATFSSTTPAGGAEITMTAPAAYKLTPSVLVSIGGVLAITDSVSADSTVAYIRPAPSSSGTPVVDNLVLSFLTAVNLTGVSATTSVTAGALTSLTGTDDPSTAPLLASPEGTSVTTVDAGTFAGTVFADFGGYPARIYKVTVANDTKVSMLLNWDNDDDLGLYVWNAADCTTGTCDYGTAIGAADNAGGGPSGRPESGTVTLTAGTYIFAVVTFDAPAGPPFYVFTLTGN